MQRIWTNKANKQNDHTNNDHNNNSHNTHLPIYKIVSSNVSNNNNDNTDKYSMPDILFNSISEQIDCVLLGESTHGTKEFYELRSIITKQLVLNKHFTAVFIEMDWPKAYILNQYITDEINSDIDSVFNSFKDYPVWMYRNSIIKDLVRWLKNLNISLKNSGKNMINLYGIDMQSYDSLDTLMSLYNDCSFLPNAIPILSILHSINVDYKTFALTQLNNAYQLFLSTKDTILKKNKHKSDIIDLVYNIDQNFLTLRSAINYFGNDCPWDTRDSHWFDTIEKYFYYKSKCKYLGFQNTDANDIEKGKIILWAHNSHVCNADFANYSHSNIGAFVKSKYGQNRVFTMCFDTFKGNVTATRNWGERAQFFNLNANVKQSYGYLWHELSEKYVHCNQFIVYLKSGIDKLRSNELIGCDNEKGTYFVEIKDVQKKTKIRDIGVCYVDRNLYAHCSNADVLEIADVMIFVNNSNALEPFDEDKDKHWDQYNQS